MESSIKQLNTLHPKLREIAIQAYNEAIKATPLGVHPIISQGYRSFEESDKLYQLGRTIINPDGKSANKPMGDIVSNAKAGQSWHNYGLAVDFALLINGKTYWDQTNPNWITVVNCFKKYGFTWGGDWKGNFKDYPHLEMKFGHTLAELQAKHNAKDFIPGTDYVNI